MGRTTLLGYELLVRQLVNEQVSTGFFLMGGPMNDLESECLRLGIEMIDTHHEQAAGMMAHAYARTSGRPGLCLTSSGPGTVNLGTSLANAMVDCAPVIALGGGSPLSQFNKGAFQELDQVAIMRPVTKWSERVYEAARIPDYVHEAFLRATSGRPGPVFLDLPGDLLYEEVEEAGAARPRGRRRLPPAASADAVQLVVDALGRAERPVLLWGSGVLWSGASEPLQALVDAAGIPFYATPQGRGAIGEEHPHYQAEARSTALREADLIIVVGTRLNWVWSFGEAPRFSADATFVQIDIDPVTLDSSPRLDVAIVADAATALTQLKDGLPSDGLVARFAPWRARLQSVAEASRAKHAHAVDVNQMPIHPVRLCNDLRDLLPRDAVLVVDGQEILNYARQSIPAHLPAHLLNSGPFGIMGVGVPFGVGVKAARRDQLVVVLSGDGAFGMNGMDIDTAVRHDLPILVVLSVNGGWSADPERSKPGRELGYPRYDQIAEVLGCVGEYVERPEEIRPALERAMAAVSAGRSALVNVVTDWAATADTVKFTRYMT